VPFLLAVLLSGIGIAGLAYLAATTVRRRAGDLAVLKVLGLDRGQLRVTIVVHIASLAIAGGVVGLALGWALADATWSALADFVPILAHNEHPLTVLVGVPVVAVTAAVVTALPAGHRATKLSAATTLRAER
jgi:putative ABC transport system permease protein